MTTFSRSLARALPLAITIFITGVVLTGCKTPDKIVQEEREREGWSSEHSWAYVKAQNNPTKIVALRLLSKPLADLVQAANVDFNKQIDQVTGSKLPKGGVGGLLESIRDNVAEAVRREEQYLQGGGSGLILLGELVGPDGRSLETNSRGAGEITQFMGDLLTTEGLGDRWSYLSMTPQEAERSFGEAGAGGGDAVQSAGREFVYNTENLLVLSLRIDAEANPTKHRVDYVGVGDVAAPATRTSSAIEGAATSFYYQPFMGEWIDEKEEKSRVEKENVLRSGSSG